MGNLAAEPTSPRYHLSIARVQLHCVRTLISKLHWQNFNMLVDISPTAFEPQRITPQLLFGHMSTSPSLARLSYEGVLGRESAKYFFDSPRHCHFRYWLLSRLTRSVTYSFNQAHGELVTFPVPCLGFFWPASGDCFWWKSKSISYIL